MVKWLAPLALAALLIQAATAASPPIDLVISNSEGGNLLDFLDHVLSEAYAAVGAHPVLRAYPAARSIEMANEGATDAEALRGSGLDHEFPNLIRVSEPIVTLEYRAYTLDTPFTGRNWQALHGRRVCINLGEKLIEERTRDMPRELAHGVDAALKMLKAGRCDMVLTNQFSWLVMERYDLGTFCAGSSVIEEIPLYHYVNRRHADLVPGLTGALRRMRESGQLERYLAADPDEALLVAARARHQCEAKDAAHR